MNSFAAKCSLLVLLTLIGCASSSGSSSGLARGYFYMEYSMVDDIEGRRFMLSYKNTTRGNVCFGPENWPSNGILWTNGSEVFVETGGEKYYLKAEQDYCPKCGMKVAPGEIITAFLDYSSFKIPENLAAAEKTLSFTPIGHRCQ